MIAPVTLASEGLVDCALLRRLVREIGLEPGDEYGKRGKDHLDQRLVSFNEAAKYRPWAISRDSDNAPCAGQLAQILLPQPANFMRFRIVVQAAEAWLLADRQMFSKVFRVGLSNIPRNPESLDFPKNKMLEILARSTSRETRDAMVRITRAGHREIGPEYNSLLSAFAEGAWRPIEASENSPSLAKALCRLAELPKLLKDE